MRRNQAKLDTPENLSLVGCAADAALPLVPLLLTLLALEWLIITCSKVYIYKFASFHFLQIPTHISFGMMAKNERKKSYAYFEAVFIAWKREWKRARHLYHSNERALIIGPWRCLSRQPFPGTLLEMSTNGNWIHLAVGVQPPLTDAQTAEMLKWQMFPRLLKPVYCYDVSLSSFRCGFSALAIKWAA